jgi:hypothetical protein
LANLPWHSPRLKRLSIQNGKAKLPGLRGLELSRRRDGNRARRIVQPGCQRNDTGRKPVSHRRSAAAAGPKLQHFNEHEIDACIGFVLLL